MDRCSAPINSPTHLRAAANGEPFDYRGVESSLAWDANGDITRFTIGVWRFDADGQIEITRRIAYDLGKLSDRPLAQTAATASHRPRKSSPDPATRTG